MKNLASLETKGENEYFLLLLLPKCRHWNRKKRQQSICLASILKLVSNLTVDFFSSFLYTCTAAHLYTLLAISPSWVGRNQWVVPFSSSSSFFLPQVGGGGPASSFLVCVCNLLGRWLQALKAGRTTAPSSVLPWIWLQEQQQLAPVPLVRCRLFLFILFTSFSVKWNIF